MWGLTCAWLALLISAPVSDAQPPSSEPPSEIDLVQSIFSISHPTVRHVPHAIGTATSAGGAPDVTVYNNVSSSDYLFTPGPDRLIADDISTVALGGCNAVRYSVLVGRSQLACSLNGAACETDSDCGGNQTCVPREDPGFAVSLGIYDACPSTGGQLIEGTDAELVFGEDGVYEIEVQLADGVFLPSEFWIGVEFDRAGAGWAVGQTSSTGYTANIYDFPIPFFACSARFIGSPIYAGYNARVTCSLDPPFEQVYLGYLNSELVAPTFAPGADKWIVDDIELVVDDCLLTSYAIATFGSGGPYTVTAEIWRQCHVDTRIAGTEGTFEATGDATPELGRIVLEEPVALGQRDVYMAWRHSSANAAAIIGEQAELGYTSDLFGLPAQGGCIFFFDTHMGFSMQVSCLGAVPLGACCDLAGVDEPGDLASCRMLPEIGCVGDLKRFTHGGHCPNTCSVDGLPCCEPRVCSNGFEPCRTDEDCGGDGPCVAQSCEGNTCSVDGTSCCRPYVCSASRGPCATDDDCPLGNTCVPQSCVINAEPFEPPCGASACCTPPNYVSGEGCFDLTIDECADIKDAEGHSAIWTRGEFCADYSESCLSWVCRYAEGDCAVSHDGVGCATPTCCDAVCGFDPWCCDNTWDEYCVAWADEFCGGVPPGNSLCSRPDQLYADSTVTVSNARAVDEPDDPPICCMPSDSSDSGYRSMWFEFVADAESAYFSTCDENSDGKVVALVLYEPLDASSPTSACDTLRVVACAVDSTECNDGTSLCATGLVPGQTYYLELASVTPADTGIHTLSVQSPCPAEPPERCPVAPIAWISPPDGTIDARQPHAVDDAANVQGISEILIQAEAEVTEPCCWHVCETPGPDSANRVVSVVDQGEGSFLVTLARPITSGASTVVSYRDDSGTVQAVTLRSHPGNANGDGASAPSDILALVDHLNGVTLLPFGDYSCDMDRSGECGPEDILRLIDLLNGAGAFEAWLDVALPSTGFCGEASP